MPQYEPQGTYFHYRNCFLFFGNRRFTRDEIAQRSANPLFVRQVHGRSIVEAREGFPTADAHWTRKKKELLVIQTADCMPVLLANSSGTLVSAIHIGWRGLAKKIFTRSLKTLRKQVGPSEIFKAWIGPHIRQHHFCLDPQSLQKILGPHKMTLAYGLEKKWVTPSPHQPGDYNVDLKGLLTREMNENGVTDIVDTKIDTFSSLDHYSFRRYRYSLGRQYSYVMINDQ